MKQTKPMTRWSNCGGGIGEISLMLFLSPAMFVAARVIACERLRVRGGRGRGRGRGGGGGGGVAVMWIGNRIIRVWFCLVARNQPRFGSVRFGQTVAGRDWRGLSILLLADEDRSVICALLLGLFICLPRPSLSHTRTGARTKAHTRALTPTQIQRHTHNYRQTQTCAEAQTPSL